MALGNTQLSGAIGLSNDVETDGFDSQAGQTWIYPTNFQEREYQYNIIQEALYKNTLVSLPTGLGKTFIAAVVMYNFYRWYPTGKIIFIAPTKPLVKQQIAACYNITAIPKETTEELTGTTTHASRIDIWAQKRVFFVTPQVLQNDLDNIPQLAKKIKCLVFDEAHKARGNHSYCAVIRKIISQHKYFRVLALSATPGSSINDVIEVTHNLLISHLELRTDESSDVVPYVFQRSLETIIVPLDGKLQQIKNEYMKILVQHTRILVQHNVINGNCSNLTKGRIFMTLKEFQEKNRYTNIRAYGDIVRALNICITLYHGYELLIRHGLRSFLNFFEEHSKKPLLRGNTILENIMCDVNNYLGPKPNVDALLDGTVPEIPHNTQFGHPKYYKLRDILLSHFSKGSKEASNVIVFCEYKESVFEAHALLMQHKPLIKSRTFLGQGAITQRQQISVVKAFREGRCNTLISTCIGEEGLDIGDVDLIVCFDITNKSPVRMVQRMGRTGRKREGRVVVLVTEGKEQQTLKECLIHKNYLSNNILTSKELNKEMYRQNPRMIPEKVHPVCQKMYLTVPNVRTKGGNLKGLFNNMARQNSASPTFSQEIQDIPIIDVCERIPELKNCWNKANPLNKLLDSPIIDFSKKLEKLRILQSTDIIGHSTNTEIFVSLLQFADSKRYNIPITQLPKITMRVSQSSPKKKSKLERCGSLDNFVQSDIRSMFTKHKSFQPSSEEIFETELSHKEMIPENELVNELHNEIGNYLSILYEIGNSCSICNKLFSCFHIKDMNSELNLNEWTQPDIAVLDIIDNNNLKSFHESLFLQSNNVYEDMYLDDDFDALANLIHIPEQVNECMPDKSFCFKSPKSVKKIFDKCDISVIEEVVPNMDIVMDTSTKLNVSSAMLFKSSNTESQSVTSLMQRYTSTLAFFKLNNLENIFEVDSSNDDFDNTIIYSPILSSTLNNDRSSPILCSYERIQSLKNKVIRKLLNNSDDKTCVSQTSETSTNVNNDITLKKKKAASCRNETDIHDQSLSITNRLKCENIISDTYSNQDIKSVNKNMRPNLANLKKKAKTNFFTSKNTKIKVPNSHCKETYEIYKKPKSLDISENLEKTDLENKKSTENKNYIQELISNTGDFCDFSIFQLDIKEQKKSEEKNEFLHNTNEEVTNNVNKSSNSEDLFSSFSDSTIENHTDINVDLCNASILTPKKKTEVCTEDICNLSLFGIDEIIRTNDGNRNDDLVKSGIDDVCDLSSIFEKDAMDPICQLFLSAPEETKDRIEDIKKSEPCSITDNLHNSQNSTMNMEASKSFGDKKKLDTYILDNINSIVSKYVSENKDYIDLRECPIKSIHTPCVDLINSKPNIESKLLTDKLMLTPDFDKLKKSSTLKLSSKTSLLEDEYSFDKHKSDFKKKYSKLRLGVKNTDTHKSKMYGNLSPVLNKTTPTKSEKNKKHTPQKKFAFNVPTGNSDDDFDCSPLQSNGWIKVRNKNEPKSKLMMDKVKKKIFNGTSIKNQTMDSSEDFEMNNKNKAIDSTTNKVFETTGSSRDFDLFPITNFKRKYEINNDECKKLPKKKKILDYELIQNEAIDEDASSDTDEGGSSQDILETSFVNDDTIDIANTTSMYIHYIKSVRSPSLNRGMYKIPKPSVSRPIDIFSQEVDDTDNTYVNDSFCVNTEEMDLTSNDVEMSELEVAEMLLQEQKKRKKKTIKINDQKRKLKKILSSDSE